MDTSKLDRSEIIGMVAATVLVDQPVPRVVLALDRPERVQRGSDPANWACGVGNSSCSGWDTFPIVRWLLIAAAAAPLILAWIVVRGHALSWPRGEVTAIVGLTAFVLIAYNGFVAKPQNGLEISLSFGYWLALLAVDRDLHLRRLPRGGERRRRPAKTARHVLALRPRLARSSL